MLGASYVAKRHPAAPRIALVTVIMSSTFVLPPLLAPGARVALVAPAGPLGGEAELRHTIDNARSFGWEVRAGAHVLEREGYLAGNDAARAADLQQAIDDPEIDGIWCVRGGYGCMRLLPALDLGALRRRPKALIGFSDITALHLALAAQGIGSFHGPTGRVKFTPFTRDSFERAVVRGEDPCGVAPGACVLHPGRVRGRLVAGNLALVSALAGTPFAASLDGAILVLEDVGEAPYRVDRMLTQLLLAGALQRCAGLVFGAFTDPPEETNADTSRSFEVVFAEVAKTLGVPCLSGVPVGHISDQWTLPLGKMAELDTEERRLRV